MKKSLLTLLPLTALMLISGRSSTNSVLSSPFKPSLTPTEIMCNSYSESMYVGESFAIKLLITPLLASDAEIVYTSSNEDVASVSSAGLIQAKKAGKAVITVAAKKDTNVKKTVSIRVFDNNGDKSKAKTKLRNIKLYQLTNEIENPKKLFTEQIKTYTLFKDDKLFSVSTQYNNIKLDADNGYVYFGGRDTYLKIEGGTTSRDFGVWQFVTDENYHSYIYHDTDNVSKYLYVPTEFNLGTDKTRIDTVYEILDSLFTNGRELVENCVEDSMGGEWFDWPNLVSSFGEVEAEKEYSFNFVQKITGESTPKMETNLDIPAYIPYTESDYFKVYWDHGVVKTFLSSFGITYYVNGVKHELIIEERNTFTRDDFVIDPIDDSKYVEAKDIYDL